jgi:predicted O-methyltransferase YrrM
LVKGPVIFASDASPEGLADAKAYIRRFGLTQDDVRLVRQDGQSLVIAKRNVFDKLRGG